MTDKKEETTRVSELEEHVRYLRRHLSMAWANGDFLRGKPSNARTRDKLIETSREIVPDSSGTIMDKTLRITMPDGSKWDVPVMVIARDRAEYYADNDDEFGGSYERSLKEDTIPLFESDIYEVESWAANNMDWGEVEDYAARMSEPSIDYEDGWANGEKEIVD